MNATSVIQPVEGPFASSMVNTLRGLSSVMAASALENFVTHREHFHSNVLLDGVASRMPTLDPMQTAQATSLLARQVREQAYVLSFSDAFLAVLTVISVLLVILLTLPKRAYPPQPPVPT
jgi:DHA2 family multidrug resistance protein